MTCIFVYGTLKMGQPNCDLMSNGVHGKAIFLGKGHTVDKYPLVIAGDYNIPFLLNIPGTGHQVLGEIYSVDDQLLNFLDEFEECPHMYQRTIEQIRVIDWEDNPNTPDEQTAVNSIIECYIYNTTTYQAEWLNLPTYEDYDSLGHHGLEYILHD